MEGNAVLDPVNEIDLAALYFVYVPNEKLDAWRHAWSNHWIRTVRSSPVRLWVSGQINCPLEIELTGQEQYFYDREGVISEAAVDKTRPIYSSTTSDIINGDLLERLRFEKPFNSLPINYGIGKFMEVVSLIEQRYESN